MGTAIGMSQEMRGRRQGGLRTPGGCGNPPPPRSAETPAAATHSSRGRTTHRRQRWKAESEGVRRNPGAAGTRVPAPLKDALGAGPREPRPAAARAPGGFPDPLGSAGGVWREVGRLRRGAQGLRTEKQKAGSRLFLLLPAHRGPLPSP